MMNARPARARRPSEYENESGEEDGRGERGAHNSLFMILLVMNTVAASCSAIAVEMIEWLRSRSTASATVRSQTIFMICINFNAN